MQPLCELSQLEQLCLHELSALKHTIFKVLASLPRLQHVILDGCDSITRLAPHIGKCKQLRYLSVYAYNLSVLSDTDCEALSRLRSLHTLILSASPTDKGLLSLCSQLSSLRVLEFRVASSRPSYTVNALAHITLLPRLEELCLPLTQDSISQQLGGIISRLCSLKRFRAPGAYLLAEAQQWLRDRLPRLEVLERC